MQTSKKLKRGKLCAKGVGRILGLFAVGGLSLLIFATLFPSVMENSFAEPIVLSDNEGALVTTSVDVQSAISLAVKQQLDFEITPHSSGSAFNKGVTTLNVNTNTDAGYNLYIHTTNEDGKLHNSREGITDTLNPIGAGVTTTSDNMPANTWGYSSDGTNYQAVPTTSTKIPGTEGATTSKTYTISIGAKIDLNIAAGKYQGNVIFSTVANPIIIEKKGWDTIKTMQEMTPEICADAPVWKSAADTRVLLDDRGSEPRKQYNVAKLKDNNCWMQENLALNGGFTLTSNDSDVATSWAMPATSSSTAGISSNTAIESRHPNNYWYYTWAAATASSGNSITAAEAIAPDSICPKGWQLPAAGSAYNTITTSGNPTDKTGSGSFYDLLMSYGITNVSSINSTGAMAPLDLIRAGAINTTGLVVVGTEGDLWARVAASNTDAYRLMWNTSSTFVASHGAPRFHGQNVRCVARQLLRNN